MPDRMMSEENATTTSCTKGWGNACSTSERLWTTNFCQFDNYCRLRERRSAKFCHVPARDGASINNEHSRFLAAGKRFHKKKGDAREGHPPKFSDDSTGYWRGAPAPSPTAAPVFKKKIVPAVPVPNERVPVCPTVAGVPVAQ